MRGRITSYPEYGRATKRVAALIWPELLEKLLYAGSRSAMPMSETAAYFLSAGFDEQRDLYRLEERDPPVVRPLPPPLPRDMARQVKPSVTDQQFQWLCALSQREFESIGTMAGRIIALGYERWARSSNK